MDKMDKKEKLKKDLGKTYHEVRNLLAEDKWDVKHHKDLWENMVDLACKLHEIVKPKHHKYMIKNRGVDPDTNTREFYNHIHPVEDLLAYMEDPHANDDPEDQTINHEFEMKIYTRRWGHEDTYKIKRTETGWEIGYLSIYGACDKSGKPYLYENLRQDSVNYPAALPEYLEWLWDEAAEEGLTHEQVQKALNQLGKWISICEEYSPKGIWEAFK